MSIAPALPPVLIDDRPRAGASTRTLDAELLDRAARDDYQQWLSTALAAGGCVRPIRLRGTVRDIDATTGEILRDLDTAKLPDKAIYIPCGDRRASVCPPCAATYRADTYQLIRAGLAGGKGVPEPVPPPPSAIPPFTAPSLARPHPRHHRRRQGCPCRPRRNANYCPTASGSPAASGRNRRLRRPLCPAATTTTPRSCGTPTPELWRRTVIGLRRSWTSSPRPGTGQTVLRQGRRVPAARPDPLPRHLPPRRPRPPSP